MRETTEQWRDFPWDVLCCAFEKKYQSPELFLLAGNVCKALKMYQEAITYWQQAYAMDESHELDWPLVKIKELQNMQKLELMQL